MTYTYTDIEQTLIHISFLMLFFATSFNLTNLFYESDKSNRLGAKIMTIASPCTTGFLVARWFQTKHLPLSNLYESSMFISWNFSLLYLISEVRNQNGLSGAVTAPGAMLTHASATLGLPEEMQQPTPLVPALQPHRLMTHVSAMLLSYATLLCGSLSAIILSSIFRGKLKNYFVFDSRRVCNKRITSLKVSSEFDARNFSHLLSLNSKKCQLINQLDKWVYQSISLGFSSSTIGILSGAVWANEAWGSYWSWDPKETWASVTWPTHATYLHTRITNTNKQMGEGPATAASTGFLLVWICFLGVNLLGVGLHNYGWLV
uniref:Cytochrome c biogenesis protein CcsA n=1 Tax=Hymenasplenium unilaterale TaxID=147939 RepID=A0A248RDK2_9MONI|nr:cytochrome c heme attachment protein [Hymenasplenium unilaterale]ASU95553.1 cytochrome c heme attachment protein [Hymenasplenium unilaterale]